MYPFTTFNFSHSFIVRHIKKGNQVCVNGGIMSTDTTIINVHKSTLMLCAHIDYLPVYISILNSC